MSKLNNWNNYLAPAIAAFAIAAAGATTSAHAGGVRVGISIGVPFPVVIAPAPVYYYPEPVYYAPPPVYYAPPAYSSTYYAPRVVYTRPYYHQHHHHRPHWR